MSDRERYSKPKREVVKFYSPPRHGFGVEARAFIGGSRSECERQKRARLRREIAAIRWPQ